MIYLDTNSLVRFFTNDDSKKALKVKNLLKKEKEVYIPEVVLPELEYVLKGIYQASREKIITSFKFLISQSNIKLDKSTKNAITIFEETKLDMADCLIASHSTNGKLASFDKQLLKVKEVKSYW